MTAFVKIFGTYLPAKLIFIISFLPGISWAQKFHFQNYNVQQGLIQSQVISITQDLYDNLWFSTLGGISRFDGKSFTNYSETDGLISNYSTTIFAGRDSNVYIGTAYGLSRFNGSKFTNYKMSAALSDNVVHDIKEDGDKKIWILAGGKLYGMHANEKPVLTVVTGSYETISAINVDGHGALWAALPDRGIYRHEGSGWKMMIPPTECTTTRFQKIMFEGLEKNKLLLLSDNAIFTADASGVRELIKTGSLGHIKNMYSDKSGHLWFTSTQGLFQYSDSGLSAFNSANGYEGNNAESFYQDREDNIWLGTSGTGVFRYSYQPFLIFDQFTVGRNSNVMAMLIHKNKLYFGTDGAGLFSYDGRKMSAVKGISDSPADQHISALFNGGENQFYALTGGGLLEKYANGRVTRVPTGEVKSCINAIYPDGTGGYWAGTCKGLFHISPNGETVRILDKFTGKIYPVSGDSMLVSTNDGLYAVAKDDHFRKVNDSILNSGIYLQVSSLGKYYLLATSNKGFIMFDRKTGERRQFTTKEGLNSDFIYSVASDHKKNIWLGTGRGVNKLVLDDNDRVIKISSLAVAGDISSSECNQDAAAFDGKNLWFGTVSGLFKFLPDSGKRSSYLPPVILQQVQVLSKDIPGKNYSGITSSWYSIPKDLVLSHDQNHLTFTFRCPSFLNSESIQYQYQLEGLEKSYSALSANHFVVYPALPPGHYTFRARAYAEGVGYSTHNVEFPFDIRAAFYQTAYFKVFLILFLMASILWIQWMRIRLRQKRLQHIEEVKREENIRVRQSASEDFHDEVGNSLTRIQVLTDVLNTKLGSEHEEEKRIIGMIKENVSGLYQGTRDILWALNPESDLIREIGHRLQSLGIDVFQDTGVRFYYENQMPESETIKLPGNYNRNIMMIFKESMSNTLKHAQATEVELCIEKTEAGEIIIMLTDNGIGFNPLFIKKGHGFENMQKRANRMKAGFEVVSSSGHGASYTLRIPIQPRHAEESPI